MTKYNLFDETHRQALINEQITQLQDELQRGILERELKEELNQGIFSK